MTHNFSDLRTRLRAKPSTWQVKPTSCYREGERNVFISEYKFWKGPKAFGEATDQLLGYATWRDGKTAILVFNRGTETSTVLAGVDVTVKAHANFTRTVNWPHESGFHYLLHVNGDKNRELIITVLVFHVPK